MVNGKKENGEKLFPENCRINAVTRQVYSRLMACTDYEPTSRAKLKKLDLAVGTVVPFSGTIIGGEKCNASCFNKINRKPVTGSLVSQLVKN